MKRVTFLIAAHNEEMCIGKVLDNLAVIKKDFPEIEVIVGNDGSTDNTENIVKRYKFVRHILLNERKGKNVVINRIIKKANGDIIIVHDADWIFKVNDKKDFERMISWFEDEKFGGIAESFPIEYETKCSNNNLAYLGNMWGTYFWIEFQKEKYTYKYGDMKYIDNTKNGFPFLVNIFRKELYTENITLGDDFERTLDIMRRGYKIAVLDDPKMPRMHAILKDVKIKDIIKQKKRTEKARTQVFNKYGIKINFLNFYLPLFAYYLRKIWIARSIKVMIALKFWIAIFIYSSLVSKLKNKNLTTERGWLMRAER